MIYSNKNFQITKLHDNATHDFFCRFEKKVNYHSVAECPPWGHPYGCIPERMNSRDVIHESVTNLSNGRYRKCSQLANEFGRLTMRIINDGKYPRGLETQQNYPGDWRLSASCGDLIDSAHETLCVSQYYRIEGFKGEL